ncbi:MAG TPA: hypothetical protein VGF13_01145 [Verrucomicrobiae bacterium]|jgi:hypothetical protein
MNAQNITNAIEELDAHIRHTEMQLAEDKQAVNGGSSRAATLRPRRARSCLANVAGESALDGLRRTVAVLASPFNRNDVDEFCPAAFSGQEVGEGLMALRKAGEIDYAPHQPGGGPTSYVRGKGAA